MGTHISFYRGANVQFVGLIFELFTRYGGENARNNDFTFSRVKMRSHLSPSKDTLDHTLNAETH